MIKLTRDEFYNAFVVPFEEHEFFSNEKKFKFYWSGKALFEEQHLKLSSNANGTMFPLKDTAIISIRYRDNQQDVLKTFIHEIAHLVMHKGRNFPEYIEEIEAEYIVENFCKRFKLHYSDSYVNEYKIKYCEDYAEEYEIKDERYELANQLINLTEELLKDYKDIICKIENKSKRNKVSVKYTVTCPKCNYVWNYKKMSKIIKKNAKGYWCPDCGKETEDKLIVKKL